MNTSVHLTGNATREPELRYTGNGKAVTSFGVAVSSRVKNEATGQWEDGDPSFYDVTCFGLLAESAAETIGKGQRVMVQGKLRQSRWEQDGAARSKVEVIADEVGTSVLFASLSDRKDRNVPAAGMSEEDPF
jgi:single-strand DNA-binding protein